MRALGADPATVDAGVTYLRWFAPGLALQFALVAMGSALRGTGVVKPTMIVQAGTVLLNIVLAPVLIAGWGTGHPLGVAGAALASTLAIAAGVTLMAFYFGRLEHYVAFDRSQWRPRPATWRRLLDIGLPAGGEFALMAVFMGVVYWVIRPFGAAAQAGFGIGMRVMQSIFLPAMAVAFAAAPIAGQNYGAKRFERVRETFRVTALTCGGFMLLLTLFCQWQSPSLIRMFTGDPAVIDVGVEYLRIISWNFVGAGIVFVCSSLFQGLGNTWPSLVSSGSRVVLFVVPAIWLSAQPGFRLVDLWHLSVATVVLQALFSLFLLRREFRTRLTALRMTAAALRLDAAAKAHADKWWSELRSGATRAWTTLQNDVHGSGIRREPESRIRARPARFRGARRRVRRPHWWPVLAKPTGRVPVVGNRWLRR